MGHPKPIQPPFKEPTTAVIEDYEVLEKVAESSRSTLYRVRDRGNGRMVALKRPLQGVSLLDWQRECNVLSAIKGGRYIVKMLEAGESETGSYLALEWLEGETLDTLADRHPLTAGQVGDLVAQALTALSAVHRAGYLHRDIKPANLMQAGDGRWRLIDFGEARPLSTASEQPLVGSIHCMAPEQFEGKPLDPRTDLYALACSAFYALTGRFAHLGETTAEVSASHLYPEPLDICHLRPDVPPPLVQCITQMLARKPEDRPRDAHAALEWLATHQLDTHG